MQTAMVEEECRIDMNEFFSAFHSPLPPPTFFSLYIEWFAYEYTICVCRDKFSLRSEFLAYRDGEMKGSET